MSRVTRWLGEMWPMPAPWLRQSWGALRTTLNDGLMGRPAMQNTTVNYNLSRSLYRNDNADYNLGAGFVRPVIDLIVEYMGLPYITTDDGERDTFLNECIHDHWAPELAEVIKASLRDSKTVVRFRQPRIDNPLFTEDDRMHGKIESIPPEMVDITFDPTDPDLVMRTIITHYINYDERTPDEVNRGTAPRVKEHEIHEIITPDKYTFYDKTMDKMLDSWTTRNPAGFVPVWPIYNEWDSTIGSGTSEIEPILPFIKAFHDVLAQALNAHKYHSTPKAKFKLKDVYTFLSNNYQDVLDPTTGQLKEGATINWTGKEIFLMNDAEDIDFIEATSVLGDSKTLLEFLIDCIAIASETPKWALLKSEAQGTDASIVPFEKKIARKRIMFNPLFVMLSKMVLVMRNQSPVTVRCAWPTIRVTDLAARGQAIQQIVMACDVAAAHGWVADATVVQILSTMFPEISEPEIEMARAKNNVVPEVAAPAPASDTQGSQPSNGNGGGNKTKAKKAVAAATGAAR